jgi:hypothetical protein
LKTLLGKQEGSVVALERDYRDVVEMIEERAQGGERAVGSKNVVVMCQWLDELVAREGGLIAGMEDDGQALQVGGGGGGG